LNNEANFLTLGHDLLVKVDTKDTEGETVEDGNKRLVDE